ncbi:pantoate--beta-alanine ligase [Wenzhouxiangella sp. AB-CW3]|uniref:pantoate--beta-alanine ligase n=1 Tax=Wenzhouxiangella sp. AB-CW3 TaxID=2771012 RepID=UPI00168B34E4|nr:pantoate--beta-alanine ligase [Wenzhouxiangella sp. AB-CW3]QOC23280.1 pantoate--beta-alanine ligase [Wenzhouxiangella sp. AB-CW3]
MKLIEQLPDLGATLDAWRRAGETIALVPTMGNLHDGHLALVAAARERARRTVVSLFVNPTQFGPNEDYESYPRTLDADLAALKQAGCDLVWRPDVATMYPFDAAFMLRVPDPLADQLCGASRPGHFDGVASVVLRLFSQVRPDCAVFGEKDYQQLVIIRHLVADLFLDIDIIGLPTIRESDGLAMSSRNAYLDQDERRRAPTLHRVLVEMAESLAAGGDFKALHTAALEQLEAAGFHPDYIEWRTARDLSPPRPDHPSRLLAAAWLGKARLIDNVAVGGKTA